MSQTQPKTGHGIPWPPLIYLAAIVIGIVLGLLYPLPWIGDLLGDILFAAGWVAVLAVVALWFTAIRAMIRAKTTLNPTGVPDRQRVVAAARLHRRLHHPEARRRAGGEGAGHEIRQEIPGLFENGPALDLNTGADRERPLFRQHLKRSTAPGKVTAPGNL